MIWVILLGVVVFRVLTVSGMSQGDDLAYTELANRFAEGNTDYYYGIFYFRWIVYLPIAVLYKVLGVNDFSSLVWTVFTSVANVYLAYQIVKLETDEMTARITAILYAFFPLVAVYGTMLETASPMEFATLLAVYLLQIGIQKENKGLFFLGGITAGFAALGRETGIFIVLLLLLYLVYKQGMNRKTILFFVIVAGSSVLPLLGQALYFHFRFGDFFFRMEESRQAVILQNQTTGMDPKDLFFYILTVYKKEGFYNSDFFANYGYLFPAAIISALVFRLRGFGIFLTWFVLYLGFMTFAPSTLSPYQTLIRNNRYMIVLILPAVAVVSIVLAHMLQTKKVLKWIGCILLFGIFSTSVWSSIQITNAFRNGHKDSKEITEFILSKNQIVYSLDQDFPRLYKYYSGYKSDKLRIIQDFSQIDQEGLLVIPLGHHPNRYNMDRKKLEKISKQPPVSWKLIHELAEYRVFAVGQFRQEDFIQILNGIIAINSSGKIDLSANDISFFQNAHVVTQIMTGFGDFWRNGDHVFIGGDNPGVDAKILLKSNSKKNVSIQMGFTTAIDFGIVEVYVNEKQIGQIDLYSEKVEYKQMEWKLVELIEGDNTLRFRILEKNPSSTSFRMGIDFIDIR